MPIAASLSICSSSFEIRVSPSFCVALNTITPMQGPSARDEIARDIRPEPAAERCYRCRSSGSPAVSHNGCGWKPLDPYNVIQINGCRYTRARVSAAASRSGLPSAPVRPDRVFPWLRSCSVDA